MPVRHKANTPAPRRHFDDPASAILAFVGCSYLATFSQLALFLRWAWFDVRGDAVGRDAAASLHRREFYF